MAATFKACALDGCNMNASRSAGGRKGYCGTHYQRIRRHGDPYREPWRNEPVEWLRSNANTKSRECLIWPFRIDTTGYGRISIKKPIGGSKLGHAHRLMCEIAKGAAPSQKHQAAHACGNRACVNPRHLSWKTQSENEADKIIHQTSNRGERCGSNKLAREDIIVICNSDEPASLLAVRYGVHAQHIRAVRRGRFWPEIPR